MYFHSKNIIILLLVDDCILISRYTSIVDEFISMLENGPEKFVFTDEVTLSSYLGVDILQLPNDEGFTLSQPYLIERIIVAFNLDTNMTKCVKYPEPHRAESNTSKVRHATIVEHTQITRTTARQSSSILTFSLGFPQRGFHTMQTSNAADCRSH